jgi:hypothetical protein
MLNEWSAPVCALQWFIHGRVNKNRNPGNIMTRTARTLIISAAMAGLVAGTMATTGCQSSSEKSGTAASSTSGGDTLMSKHDCKGLNSCKGQGGCSQGDQGCKGKNSCKGKGGCKVT